MSDSQNDRDLGQNARDVAQNARDEDANTQWRIGYVLADTVDKLTRMGNVLDSVVNRLNGEEGLSARVQRLEEKTGEIHDDFAAFAQQQQLNHIENKQEALAARDFRRKLWIAAVPLVPTLLGGIGWLVWRSVIIFQVHHL